MNKFRRGKLAHFFAIEMMKHRDTIDGLAIVLGGGNLTLDEMCQIGRDAIDLIEGGIVK